MPYYTDEIHIHTKKYIYNVNSVFLSFITFTLNAFAHPITLKHSFVIFNLKKIHKSNRNISFKVALIESYWIYLFLLLIETTIYDCIEKY